MMCRPAIVLLWVAGLLFPMAWLTRFSGTYSRLFGHVFNPLWVHVLMHALLFAVLAYLLIRQMAGRAGAARRWRTAALVMGLVLAIAVAQEGIQLLYKARPAGADEVLDVGIDLAGGLFGAVLGGLRREVAQRFHLPRDAWLALAQIVLAITSRASRLPPD